MTTEHTSPNVVWHQARVSREARETLNGHQGAVLWFTGLSGSGKSTIANAVEALLHRRGIHTYLLDGDNIRHGLNRDLAFSAEDRAENIRRIGEVAALLCDAGLVTLTAFISPYRADRDAVRTRLPEGRFIEVFVDCPLDICEQRDPKGLYARARAGEITDFTGVSAPYEAPEVPEVTLNSGTMDVDACARATIDMLVERGVIPAG